MAGPCLQSTLTDWAINYTEWQPVTARRRLSTPHDLDVRRAREDELKFV